HLYLLIDTATTEIYTLSLHDALPILDMGFGHEKKDGVDSSLESFSLLRICRYLRWNFAVRPCRHAWASFNCNLSEFFECKQSRRSEEHTSELQSLAYLVCRLLLEKKK